MLITELGTVSIFHLASGKTTQDGFTKYPFLGRFYPFWHVFFLQEKVRSFSFAFLYVHIDTSQTVTCWTKVFEKNFFKAIQLYFEIQLLSLTRKIFEPNFYQCAIVYLVRIWTQKNADEKEYTFSWSSKNVKKNEQKWILG